MTKKLARIHRLLTANRVPHLVVPSADPQQEDDQIVISPMVHIQVGNGYMAIVTELEDGTFSFQETSERRLLADLLPVQL